MYCICECLLQRASFDSRFDTANGTSNLDTHHPSGYSLKAMPFQFPEYTLNALTGLRCGDIFGANFEYSPNGPALAQQSLTEQRFLCSVKDCGGEISRYRLPGLWTDDTQQGMLLIWCWKQMVDRNLADPATHPEQVAELFMRICNRMSTEHLFPGAVKTRGYFGVHRGTGGNFRQVVRDPKQVPVTAGMGAAMRIGPVATLLPDETQVAAWVLAVSSRTTSDPWGLAAAIVYALMAHRLSRGLPISGQVLRPLLPDSWHTNGPEHAEYLVYHSARFLVSRVRDYQMYSLGSLLQMVNEKRATVEQGSQDPLPNYTTGYGPTGVLWAYHAVERELNLAEICATEGGGDTDTIAALCLCLQVLAEGDTSMIPNWILTDSVPLDPYTWHPISTEKLHCRTEIEARSALSPLFDANLFNL